MTDTNGSVGEERVFFMSGLKLKWSSMAGGWRSSFNMTMNVWLRTFSGCSAWRVWKGVSARGDLCYHEESIAASL